MTPALARIKRGVREAVDANGGIDGAGATAKRSRSSAGNWRNLAHDDFPPLDCALALDEVALARDGRAPILESYAAELGHVAIRLPDAAAGDALGETVIESATELGDVARAFRAAMADGKRSLAELEEIERQYTQLIAVASLGQQLCRREIESLRGRGG